jgi:hypothetical protein
MIFLVSLAHVEQPQVLIDVQHDSVRSVTCWITPSGGISCLPDSSLPQKATAQSPAEPRITSRCNTWNGDLQADSLPQHVEVFQL